MLRLTPWGQLSSRAPSLTEYPQLPFWHPPRRNHLRPSDPQAAAFRRCCSASATKIQLHGSTGLSFLSGLTPQSDTPLLLPAKFCQPVSSKRSTQLELRMPSHHGSKQHVKHSTYIQHVCDKDGCMWSRKARGYYLSNDLLKLTWKDRGTAWVRFCLATVELLLDSQEITHDVWQLFEFLGDLGTAICNGFPVLSFSLLGPLVLAAPVKAFHWFQLLKVLFAARRLGLFVGSHPKTSQLFR